MKGKIEMATQTIQSLAVIMSDAGYNDYVIVDLVKTSPESVIPHNLPHGVATLVDTEKTAIEFDRPEDEDEAGARQAYEKIIKACTAYAAIMRGSITLVEEGEVETTTIG